MAKPKNTQNIGTYWKEKIKLTETEIKEWIYFLKKENKFINILSKKEYPALRSFLSSLKKLDNSSRLLFNFYFRKIYLNNNKCIFCNKEIEKEFILQFNTGINRFPNWCEEHYRTKKWLDLSKDKKYGNEANLKRSIKRKQFLNSEKGKEYCANVGLKNTINTKIWKNNLTQEEKNIINKKSSSSQIKNILEGRFDPQKNYKHFYKNECFVNNKLYILRSSWEVIFFISNYTLEYESLRIKYLKNNGSFGVYIPDFIDKEKKILYELKPRRNYIKQQTKMDAGILWCLENGYKFIWINEDNLLDYISKQDNKDSRNNIFYQKAFKGINGNIKNKINKKNRN